MDLLRFQRGASSPLLLTVPSPVQQVPEEAGTVLEERLFLPLCNISIFLSLILYPATGLPPSYLDFVPGSPCDWQRVPSLFSLHSTCLKFQVYVRRTQFTLN